MVNTNITGFTKERDEALTKAKNTLDMYIRQIVVCSRDELPILRNKIEFLREFITNLKDIDINVRNYDIFNEIIKYLDSIKKIKGNSSIDTVREKYYVLIEQMNFINENYQQEAMN